MEILKMPLYAGKHAICAFLRNMRNMLRSHVRYKPVSLTDPDVTTYLLQSRCWAGRPTQTTLHSIDWEHPLLHHRSLPAWTDRKDWTDQASRAQGPQRGLTGRPESTEFCRMDAETTRGLSLSQSTQRQAILHNTSSNCFISSFLIWIISF